MLQQRPIFCQGRLHARLAIEAVAADGLAQTVDNLLDVFFVFQDLFLVGFDLGYLALNLSIFNLFLVSINSGKSPSAFLQMSRNFSYFSIALTDRPFSSYNLANL